jgi:hypothetical protein
MPDTFRPVRPFKDWPSFEPKAFDPRDATFIPSSSISDEQVNRISPRKLRLVGIKVYNAAASNSIATGTDTTVTFDTASYAQGFNEPSGATFTTITVPFDGVYQLIADVEWAAGTMGRSVWFYINSTKTEGDTRSSDADSIAMRASLTTARVLIAGDTLALRVWQNSGGNLSVNTGESNCALAANYLGAI